MKAWNIVIFEGFISSNYELSFSKNDKPYARLWLTNREKGQGDYEIAAEMNVTIFGKTAENFTGQKGDRVVVRGYFQTSEYNDKKYTDVIAEKIDVVWKQGTKPVVNKEQGPPPIDDSNLPF